MANEHVLIVYLSICPKDFGRRSTNQRIRQYEIAVAQLKRVLPSPDWKVVFCENTLPSPHEVRRFVEKCGIESPLVSWSNTNLGAKNKGLGEVSMALQALADFPDLFNIARTISCKTGRHLLISTHLLELTKRMNADALIGNPDFIYLDGEVRKPETERVLNTMFYSMRTDVYLKFLEFSAQRMNEFSAGNLSAEANLFDFVEYSRLDVEQLNYLGVLRLEKIKGRIGRETSRWHLC